MDKDKKLGVYLCGGCGLAEALDTNKLATLATREGKAGLVRTHAALCSPEGVAQIRADLDGGAANTVVVAACSGRMKTEAFAGFAAERVNLREHVAWCHPPGHEDTHMLAEDYLRMGMVRARKSEVPTPLAEQISRVILVVGGGITGVTAALEAAAAGHDVVLVEQQAPFTPSNEAVLYHPRIRCLTGARILGTSGQPGMFDVTVAAPSGEIAVRAGAIIVATGWKPYDATRLAHLGYGTFPGVVTSHEFERLAAEGQFPASVLFLQCAGSRDPAHLPYCSSVCCVTTLKQIVSLRARRPQARAYVVYKDLRAPGH